MQMKFLKSSKALTLSLIKKSSSTKIWGLWKHLLYLFSQKQTSASVSHVSNVDDVFEVHKGTETFIDEKIKQYNNMGNEVPFYVANLNVVFEKYQKWKALLPRVAPFFAMKCNNTPAVLRILSALGTGFDCASQREMEMVMSLGVKADKIIYAHTTKPLSHIRYACAQGVDMMTFDSEEELIKISAAHPKAKLVLRIAVDDSKSLVPLNCKFGAPLASVGNLLKQAHDLHLNIRGVSFHVGSMCTDVGTYKRAIASARQVFDQAKVVGFQLDLLDIGGGFTGPEIEMVSAGINEALDEFFPADSGVSIIAEPGWYFVESAFTLALNVFAKKKIWNNPINNKDGNDLDTQFMYYVMDGIYGSFLTLRIYPDINPFILRPHRPVSGREPWYQSVIWGPSCDSADRIMDVWMPELNVGDWILVENIGAYTLVLSTGFNGFEKPKVYAVGTAKIRDMLNFRREM